MNAVFPFVSFFQKEFPEISEFVWKTGSFNSIIRYLVHKGGFNIKRNF